MKKILCKCGHGINAHNALKGCQHVDTVDNYNSVCGCWQSPQDIAESALRELEKALEDLRDLANGAAAEGLTVTELADTMKLRIGKALEAK